MLKMKVRGSKSSRSLEECAIAPEAGIELSLVAIKLLGPLRPRLSHVRFGPLAIFMACLAPR